MRKAAMWFGGTTCLLNIGLFFANPMLRRVVDSFLSRSNPPDNPSIGIGCQELLVYYDPWFALTLHGVFVLGIPLIPFLLATSNASQRSYRFPISIAIVLFFQCIWLSQIFVCLFCRGPHWNFFFPWETQDPWRVQVLNTVDLSQWVWHWWWQTDLPMPPQNATLFQVCQSILQREFFGIGLLLVYAMTGLAVGGFLAKRMGNYRMMLVVLFIQLGACLPLKILFRITWNVKYFISIPEWQLNF